MRFVRQAFASFVFLVLAACGGGGGGGGGSDTSISLTQSALSFEAEQNAAAPVAQNVIASFKGDGVVVGTLPGQTQPTWLAVADAGHTTTQATFAISVLPGAMAPGTYISTLRFVTGHADGSSLKFVDVSISLHVVEGFSATSGALNFTEIDGDAAGAQPTSFAASIRGANISWRATATQPWISLSASAGTTAATLTIRTTRQALAVGTYTGSVQIIDDKSGRVANLSVSYVIRPARLTVNKTTLAYSITPSTTMAELATAVVLSDELNGTIATKDVAWTATTDQPWLTVAPASGRSAPSAPVNVRIDSSKLALTASGTYTAHLNVGYVDSAGVADSMQIPVTLVLRMPLARAASPYAVAVATPTSIVLRGEDFQDVDLAFLRVDGNALTGTVNRTDTTAISVSLPGLTAGRHTLTFTTGVGLARSVADVVTLAAAPTTSSISVANHNLRRLVYDAERARLYAIDRTAEKVDRYDWNGTSWTARAALSVPNLRDAALTRSGRELVIVAADAIFMVDAADLTALPQTVATRSGVTLGQYVWDELAYVGVLDSGLAVIAQTFPGSGHTQLLGFDTVRRESVFAPPAGNQYYEGRLGVSTDGHYALIGGLGVSPAAEASLLDSRAVPNSVFGSAVTYPSGNFLDFDLGRDGAHVLENFTDVKDRTGHLIGSLPHAEFARLSPDGNKAYVFDRSTSPGKILIYDLAVTPFVKSATEIALPAAVITPLYDLSVYPSSQYALAGLVSPNGKALFLAGPDGIVVVSLP